MSHTCFIDESGDFGALNSANAGAQPTFVVVGLMLPDLHLPRLADEFIALRRTSEFLKSRRAALGLPPFPAEDKGKDMFRWALKSPDPAWRDGALAVLGAALDLLERADARVAGGVHIKPADRPFDGGHQYAAAALSIAANFRRAAAPTDGRIICDEQQQARALVRRLFRHRGRPPPAFENSAAHAGLQLADWLCSAMLAPLAATACCDPRALPNSKHLHRGYRRLREGDDSPWARLIRMQLPFADDDGMRRPGILVHPPRLRPALFPQPEPSPESP